MKIIAFAGALLVMAVAIPTAHACTSASAAYGDTRPREGLYVLDDAILHGVMTTTDSVIWFATYADQGIAEAQYNLAVLYERGDGVAKDEAKAIDLYRRAAEQKFPQAKFNLGVMHHLGVGTPQNHAEAARLYRLAAGHGIAHAHFNLGLLYFEGKGVPRDETEALRWCKSAASQ